MKLFYNEGQSYISLEGRTLTLPAPLQDVLIDGLTVYVLVDPNLIERNIFAYNSDGTLKWQIQRPPYDVQGEGFCLIQKTKKGVSVNARGYNFAVDVQTGEVFIDPAQDPRF